jgi:hypothetical protein
VSQFAVHRLRTGDEPVCRIQTDLGVATPFLLFAPVVRRDVWARRSRACTWRSGSTASRT